MSTEEAIGAQSAEICSALHRFCSTLPRHKTHKDRLPKNGLYIFFEDGETACHGDLEGDRIVRIGNHPQTQDGLAARLTKHYTGSKRTSVLLRDIGGAMLRRDLPESPCLEPSPGKGHWERQKGKYCAICEPYKAKSKCFVHNQMTYVTIPCDDMHKRNRLEKILIASVSICPCCSPSPTWLGLKAYDSKVRDSGLWQTNHVCDFEVLRDADTMDLVRDLPSVSPAKPETG
jgi:hypothetical protein